MPEICDALVHYRLRPLLSISADKVVMVFCSLICVGFLSAAAIQWHKSATYRSGTLMQVSTAEVIGAKPDFRGNLSSKLTLVEFGDYQCPPCRASFVLLQKDLNPGTRKIRFEFRNFPLTSIHPYAYDASVLAEVAREENKHWAVHDALYKHDISANSLLQIAKEFDLGSERKKGDIFVHAKNVVDQDMKCGELIGVNSTPTFILCYPNGDAVRLTSLQDLPAAITEKP